MDTAFRVVESGKSCTAQFDEPRDQFRLGRRCCNEGGVYRCSLETYMPGHAECVANVSHSYEWLDVVIDFNLELQSGAELSDCRAPLFDNQVSDSVPMNARHWYYKIRRSWLLKSLLHVVYRFRSVQTETYLKNGP